MVIIEDTRNQPNKHKNINAYLKRMGHTVVRSKMYVGDYCIANNARIAIDTKKDVLELIMDLHKDHQRFKAEMMNAQAAGIQLIVLVEEALPDGKLENWRSPVYQSTNSRHRKGEPLTRSNPATLKKALITMQERYGVRFYFCDGRSSGRILLGLLEGKSYRDLVGNFDTKLD